MTPRAKPVDGAVRTAQDEAHGRHGQGQRQGAVPGHLRHRRPDARCSTTRSPRRRAAQGQRPSRSSPCSARRARVKIRAGGRRPEGRERARHRHGPSRPSSSSSKALGPIDGIVGFPFFARYKMTLDYQAKTMTFVPNGFEPPDVMQAMMATLDGHDAATSKPPARCWRRRRSGAWWSQEGQGDEEAGVTIKEVLPGRPRRRRG